MAAYPNSPPGSGAPLRKDLLADAESVPLAVPPQPACIAVGRV